MDDQKAKNSIIFLMVSVLFLIVGMFLITFIGTFKKNGAQDIRTRASQASTLELTAIVTNVDAQDSILTVKNLQFSGNTGTGEDLGEFFVTMPIGFSPSKITVGTRVRLTVIASSFNTAERTVSATKIDVLR